MLSTYIFVSNKIFCRRVVFLCYMPNESHPFHIPKKILVAFGVAVFALFAVAFLYDSDISKQIQKLFSYPQPEFYSSGQILLNLSDGSGEQLYRFDVSSRQLVEMPWYLLSPSLSQNSTHLIGSATTFSESEQGLIPALFGMSDESPSLDVLYASSTLTDELFRNPKINEVGAYVFNVHPNSEDENEIYTPNLWAIYYSEGAGLDPVHIADGIYPNISLDGSRVLYLADDGIHMYTVNGSEDVLVHPMFSGSASANMMMTVSKNGSRLAITNPSNEELILMEIDWEESSVQEIATYSIAAFWPVFSPDGEVMAVQEIDWVFMEELDDYEPTNARLTLIDLNSGETSSVLDLSGYEQMQLFVGDWVAN